MPIHAWGTDFNRSDPEFRKHLFLADDSRADRIRDILRLGFRDLYYIHTCNRVEFYTTARNHFEDARPLWLSLLRYLGLPDQSFYKGYALEGKSAVRHLVRVACSLESMVIGEPQINGQLKNALAWTLDQDLPVSAPLQRALQLAFQTAKEVRSITGIGEKPLSVANLGLQRFRTLETEKKADAVAVVGRSSINRIVIRWLKENRPGTEILWVNRNPEALLQYEESQGLECVGLDTFLEAPKSFDYLFTATSSPEPIFGNEFFDRVSDDPAVLFDFAQPSDICADCVPAHFKLLSMDDLAREADENKKLRMTEILRAEPIIEQALHRFYLEQKETPLLRDFSTVEPEVLRSLYEELQGVEKWVPAESYPKFEKWARSLVKKHLHLSREHLRGILREAAAAESQSF
ncbi:MAG: hypothetical protein H6617_06930 [Bdellovibrionaceae bacterium]|nr:hypothetical protein [Pseudobdellovibrionaceae bacterium]